MVNSCCVTGCYNESYPGSCFSFHVFPKNINQKSKWENVVPGKVSKSSVVCSAHFKSDDFIPGYFRKRLKPDAIPSIFPKAGTSLTTSAISCLNHKMASAEFLEQALSTDVDENAVNAIVGSLVNHFVTSAPSISSQNNLVNVIPNQISISTSDNTISGPKYTRDQSYGEITVGNFQSSVSSASFSVPSSFVTHTVSSESVSNLGPLNNLNFSTQTLANACVGLSSPQSQIVQTVQGNSFVPHSGIHAIAMQPIMKQGTPGQPTGQVNMQPGMVPAPMTVNSSIPCSIPNVMNLNKPGGQNVVVTTQNLGSAQSILPNVQILNMRPGAPNVAAQKSVATVSPRVVIGTPQVVGTRPAAPGITLQTLQSLQQGQQGHLLLKTENGQYQLLRVGPAPANTLTAPQQALRLSTVPAHPGVATMSTSVATQMAGQMPAGPVATPVPASSMGPLPSPGLSQPTVTTQKPLDNTKEKCRNFLANLLDLSSKEPKSVEDSVRNLIQELIDAQVEPEEFCDRLERLLNASPQPCLIGFLKKSLPLLRQSLVTKELVIEGINPPSPTIAFSTLTAPSAQMVTSNTIHLSEDEGSSSPTLTTLLPLVMPILPRPPSPKLVALSMQNISQSDDEGSSSPVLTTLLPPVMPVLPRPPSPKPVTVTVQNIVQQKPPPKSGSTIAVLQNIPVHTKINMTKAGKTMTANSKSFSRSSGSSALSTVLTPGKSLLKDKKGGMQFPSQGFTDDKMAGDDDINDVAAMGGVNLAEESQRILGSTDMIGTQIRSCKDEFLVPMSVMQAKVKALSAKHGLGEPTPDVAALLNHALYERMKTIVEKLAVIAQHRIDMETKTRTVQELSYNSKTDPRYEITQDVKGQLKFLEEVDRMDKKKREDSEREMLLRAAKSRSKNEDPEQAKLKAKAKEMQRAELEELRQREANLTALQAIGPRKRARMDGPSGSAESTSSSSNQQAGFSGRSQLALRSRLKRINIRDLIHLLEQEPETSRSLILYRSYLK